jgi:hypothetical protein
VAVNEIFIRQIKPWSWFVMRIGGFSKAVTILPTNKINDERFSTFEYSEGNNWAEYLSSITKSEWVKYTQNDDIELVIAKKHPEWSKYAKKAIRLIFSKSTDLYVPKA